MDEIEKQFKKESIIACGNDINICQIDSSRQYWFIRSDSGNYYNDFIQNDYVAIGWDYLLQNNFQFDKTGELLNDLELKALINGNEKPKLEQSTQGRKATITKIFNKVYKFIFEVEEGDIVITPSENTNQISIGVVDSALYEDANYEAEYLTKNPDTELTLCPFIKRRKIHWLKHIQRNKLDIYLLNAFQSQEAMTNLNDHAEFINRNLYDAYIAGNSFHNIIKTTSDGDLTLSEITFLFNTLSEIINTVTQKNSLSFSTQDVKIKINAHSPMMLDLTLVSDAINTIAPILLPAIAAGGVGGISITQFGKYKINQVTQNAETQRTKLQEQTKQNEINRKTALQALEMRSKLVSEEERKEFDEAAEKLGLINKKES